MPKSVKVCIWNVQNYGSGGPDLRWGTNSNLRNRFIRDFLRSQGVDVLLMMEASVKAEASLADLVRVLNMDLPRRTKDWVGAFCGSGITEDADDPPAGPDEVTFQTDARTEGYAVFWRARQNDRFTMVPALTDIATALKTGVETRGAASPINLSLQGRPEEDTVIGRKRRRGGPAVAGYTPPHLYPFDAHGALLADWPELTMPTTGRLNAAERSVAQARRPAYVVLDLKIDGAAPADRLCPVLAYHAPSNDSQAQTGTAMAGMARELYVIDDVDPVTGRPVPAQLVHPRRVVAGGDFNYSVPEAEWPGEYRYFNQPFAQDRDGGADCTQAPYHLAGDAARRTTVRLSAGVRGTGGPIQSADPADYLALKIDLAFFRRNTNTAAERVEMLSLLTDPVRQAPYVATLQAFHAHLASLVRRLRNRPDQYLDAAGRGPWQARQTRRNGRRVTVQSPMISGGWGATFVDWDAFMAQLRAGRLTGTRQAAEFYRMFVSDHLPLVVTLNF